MINLGNDIGVKIDNNLLSFLENYLKKDLPRNIRHNIRLLIVKIKDSSITDSQDFLINFKNVLDKQYDVVPFDLYHMVHAIVYTSFEESELIKKHLNMTSLFTKDINLKNDMKFMYLCYHLHLDNIDNIEETIDTIYNLQPTVDITSILVGLENKGYDKKILFEIAKKYLVITSDSCGLIKFIADISHDLGLYSVSSVFYHMYMNKNNITKDDFDFDHICSRLILNNLYLGHLTNVKKWMKQSSDKELNKRINWVINHIN